MEKQSHTKMVPILILVLSLLSINLAHGNELNINELYQDANSVASAILEDNVIIAGYLQRSQTTSWQKTLVTLIPNLDIVHDTAMKVFQQLNDLIKDFQQAPSSNSNNIYVPNAVIQQIYNSFNTIKSAFGGVNKEKFRTVFAANTKKIVPIVNGTIIIDASEAFKVEVIVEAISIAVRAAEKGFGQLEMGLLALAEAILENTSQSFGIYLFKQFSLAFTRVATGYGNIANCLHTFVESYNKLIKYQSNGTLAIPAQKLQDITNTLLTSLSTEFDSIANAMGVFLYKIQESN